MKKKFLSAVLVAVIALSALVTGATANAAVKYKYPVSYNRINVCSQVNANGELKYVVSKNKEDNSQFKKLIFINKKNKTTTIAKKDTTGALLLGKNIYYTFRDDVTGYSYVSRKTFDGKNGTVLYKAMYNTKYNYGDYQLIGLYNGDAVLYRKTLSKNKMAYNYYKLHIANKKISKICTTEYFSEDNVRLFAGRIYLDLSTPSGDATGYINISDGKFVMLKNQSFGEYTQDYRYYNVLGEIKKTNRNLKTTSVTTGATLIGAPTNNTIIYVKGNAKGVPCVYRKNLTETKFLSSVSNYFKRVNDESYNKGQASMTFTHVDYCHTALIFTIHCDIDGATTGGIDYFITDSLNGTQPQKYGKIPYYTSNKFEISGNNLFVNAFTPITASNQVFKIDCSNFKFK